MDLNTLNIAGKSSVSDVLLQMGEDISPISESLIESLMIDEATNTVAVRITAQNIDALTPVLDNLEFEVLGSAPEHHFIEGYIALDALSDLQVLATEGLLMGVLPVYRPETNVGLIDSQADFVHKADRVRTALPTGYDGTGQTIAAFSDSYNTSGNGLEIVADIFSGDLPAGGVTVLQDFSGGIDEGRAMLQLVHDLAPGADLVFSSVSFGEANFAQQIRDAANPAIGNASVLVDDIVYFAEPFFQDGIVAQAVDAVVTNEGVTYFSSAGNSSADSYESNNINFAPDSEGGFPDSFYDFDLTAGVDSRQEITLDAGQTFLATLQWDDPFYTIDGVDTDLLFGLIDSSNNIYAIANENNIANQTPFEFLVYTNNTGATQTLEVVITKVAGPDPTRLKYINFRDHNPTEYDTNSSTVFGHNSATNAQAVAAIPFFDQDTPEFFTSEGPTTILFEPDGTPLATPEIRNTPDIAAIDGTNTTFFGFDISEDLDSFPNFFGTSAAAPHAAAVAALIQEANPSFTPQDVYNLLQSTAEDIAPAGFDNVTGFGLINAYDAIFGSPVPATLPFSENFDDGDLPLAFETNTNGAGRIEVTSDFSPLGVEQLVLYSSSSDFDITSLNEAILHLDTTDFTDIVLSFEQKEFEDEDDVMPATFVGSNNSDGVALSVDGTNWVRLVDLTGSNSTASFQTHIVDISAAAAANGLTLGSDVQIKFQQFDNFLLTDISGFTDGFAFDNISVTGTPTGFSPEGIRVEAEDYVNFFDTTSGNTGGAYRNDDVDIESSDDIGEGYNVGWINQGEWLTYDVDIPEDGFYQIVTRVASALDDRTHSLDITLDGQTSNVSFDGTGGWQSWSDFSSGNLSLTAGSQELRLDMGSSGFNINYIDLLPLTGSRIEAENYVNYFDTTSGNTGGAYRNDDVDIESSNDIGGGHNVGWISQGEWLTYQVDVPEDGSYQISARVASNLDRDHNLDITLDGQTTSLGFGDTGGWQSWENAVSGGINLTAGSYEMRLDMGSSGFNLNYIELIPQIEEV